MTNRIISIIGAIDGLCNLGMIMGAIMFTSFIIKGVVFRINSDFGIIFYTIRVICILGVIFIPNKETLVILLSK